MSNAASNDKRAKSEPSTRGGAGDAASGASLRPLIEIGGNHAGIFGFAKCAIAHSIRRPLRFDAYRTFRALPLYLLDTCRPWNQWLRLKIVSSADTNVLFVAVQVSKSLQHLQDCIHCFEYARETPEYDPWKR